jgi:predicted dehydrogenase
MEIAVVGLSKVAENNYLPTFLRHKDLSITCYSRTLSRAEEFADKFGVRPARTFDELFERQPQAVFVLTREDRRMETTQALLPFKPIRLFLEKPLVAMAGQAHVVPQDFWDAKQLLMQAQEMGTETAMVFNYRFFDQVLRARRIIDERSFGCAVNVVAYTHFACWSHCIDLILEFAGPLHQISAHQGNQPHPFFDEEATDISASFLIGEQASGVLLGTSGMNWTYPLFELIINFEGGRIHFRDLDQTMEVLDYRSKDHEVFSPVRSESRWTKYNESFEKSLDAYLDSIRMGTPPPVPGIAGLLELQFEASLKKSIAECRTVIPSEEFPTQPVC